MAATGCGAASPGDSDGVTVTFWHLQVGQHEAALKEQVAEFERQNPDVHVELMFQGDSATIHQKVLAALTAGNPPTMAESLEPAKVAEYLNAGALVPVDTLASAEELDLDDTYPGFLADGQFTVDGKEHLVAWPFARSLSVLWYNGALLDEHGIDGPPATWQELQAKARQLTSSMGGPGFAWNPAGGMGEVYGAILGNGGDLATAGGKKAGFDSPASVAFLEQLVTMARVDESMRVTEAFDWQAEFASQRAGFVVGSSASSPFMSEAIGGTFERSWAPFPAGSTRSAVVAYGTTVSVFAKASPAEQEAAWRFLEFFSSPEQAAKWTPATAYGFVPLRPSAWEIIDTSTAEPGAVETLKAESEAATPRPKMAAWNAAEAALAEAIQAALSGRQSAAEAAGEAERKANEHLAAG